MYYMTTYCFASHIFFPLLLFPIAGVKWCGAHLKACFESLGLVLGCALNYHPLNGISLRSGSRGGRSESAPTLQLRAREPMVLGLSIGHSAVHRSSPPNFHNLLLFSVSENLRRVRLLHILKSARYHFLICPKGNVSYLWARNKIVSSWPRTRFGVPFTQILAASASRSKLPLPFCNLCSTPIPTVE